MAGKVLPFAFDGLPRVPAISVARSRAIARGLAGAEAFRGLTGRGLGRLNIDIDNIEPVPWRGGTGSNPSPETSFMLVWADGSAGCLTVERYFALSLVRAALSAPVPPVLRPLSPAERGVLGALVAGALAGAGRGGIRVSLERARPVDERERIAFNLTVRTSGTSGAVLLEIPTAWLPTAAASIPLDTAPLLETTLVVSVGSTELPGSACLAAELGDVVVFEGVSAPHDDQPWPCRLHIGSMHAGAELGADGDVRLGEKFIPGPDAPVHSMSDSRRSPEGDGAGILASSPVEVVAEIGRVALRGDEVLGLVSGTVLSLGERRRDLVTLRVGGRVWARGELVNVDDELGVRITEIVRQR